ncbi:ferritin-like domain-containing protein [Wenzhouxiangella limi]|uniref:Ferritin-like domain-containing protein n=1 Tax=Wenzhouxiangella limi TaxID=2707351 RepID=A0A845UYU2_9GAMM|nr:ferritin-like domain-containing protein [Wenzhouxiangella limi]NDY96993.1 ferritin-like domain-containing protein [Wenzhouxiangella limi]
MSSGGQWEQARAALAEPDPPAKCRRVAALWAQVASGQWVPTDPGPPGDLPCGRPQRPEMVPPSQLPRRGLGSVEGRQALIHAIAHIEFNAINLGLDAALRFPGMPDGFYRDWLSVAADEARHFAMLNARLGELGTTYGDLPAHNGLWEMAEKTAHDVLIRMALVPRVLEARGLDVTPGMIDRLAAVGDEETVALLQVILEEEEEHVAIGSRWFRALCAQRKLEPEATFRRLLEEYFNGPLRGPFNLDARRRAGFSAEEIDQLAAMDRADQPA